MLEGGASLLERLSLVAEKAAMGEAPGRIPEALLGQGRVPAGHRPYVPGDDPRWIDPKASARLDRPVVRSFRREREQRLHLVLDVSASMERPFRKRFETARSVTAALGVVALAGLEDLRVSTVAERGRTLLGGARGRQRTAALLAALEELPTGGGTHPAALARLLAGAPRGLVVWVTDFLDPHPPEAWVGALAGPSPSWVLVLAHPLDPLPEGAGAVEIVDPEGGGRQVVDLDDGLRRRATERVRRHRHARAAALREIGVRVVELDATRDWTELLLGPLRAAGLVLAP